MENDENKPVFDYAAAAAYLTISEKTLRVWVHQKRIPCFKIGGKSVRFSQKQLNDFIKKSEVCV